MLSGRILLVNDDPVVIGEIRTIVSAHGLNLSVASAGGKRLRLPDIQLFDMIVADLSMGTAPVKKIMRQVKRRCPGKPVLVLTGKGGIQAVSQVVKGSIGLLIRAGQKVQKIPATVSFNQIPCMCLMGSRPGAGNLKGQSRRL